MVLLTSFPPPSDGVRHRQENTAAHVQGKAMGQGTLFIAESRVSWMGVEGQGFSIEYPAITLHAISRDLSAFPHPCLYLMVDADLGEGSTMNGTSESSGEEDSDSSEKISEIRFIPSDPTSLDTMFKVMSECQCLHPDQNDSISDEDEDEEGYFEAEDGEQNLSEQGQETLHRLGAMLDPGDDGIVQDEPQIGAIAAGEPRVVSQEEEDMDTAQFEDAD